MKNISQLQMVNSTLSKKKEILKKEAEIVLAECEARIAEQVQDFIKSELAPALNVPTEKIKLIVRRDSIEFGINGTPSTHSIRTNRGWRTKEREISLSWFSTSVEVKDKVRFEQYALGLWMLGFLANEILNESDLSKKLIALCDMLENELIPSNIKWDEVNSIRNAIEANESEIMNLRIDEYFNTGVRYSMDNQHRHPLWLNDKDKTYLQEYSLTKISPKKVFIKLYAKGYEHDCQTSIDNYRSYIKDVIEQGDIKERRFISIIKTSRIEENI